MENEREIKNSRTNRLWKGRTALWKESYAEMSETEGA